METVSSVEPDDLMPLNDPTNPLADPKNMSPSKADEDGATASSTVARNAFRVKRVSEINGKSNGSIDENSTVDTHDSSKGEKRKLPSWMTSSSETDDNGNYEAPCSSSNSKKVKNTGSSTGGDSASSCNTQDAECHTNVNKTVSQDPDIGSNSTNEAVVVKTEPPDTNGGTHASSLADAAQASTSTSASVADIKPAVKIEKEEATSTSRESCKYGIRCYRRNPMHRIEEAHPGDHDYKRPSYPPPPKGTPDCPYGDCCYRRNPSHFQRFSHPPDTDFQQNWKNHRMRLRQRRQQQNTNNDNDDNSSDLDDSDLDDPFLDDGDLDLDYVPSQDINDVDDDDDADYDDCDKAEE